MLSAAVALADEGGADAIGAMLRVVALNAVVRQRLAVIVPSVPSGPAQADLSAVTALVGTGRLTSVIGRTRVRRRAYPGRRTRCQVFYPPRTCMRHTRNLSYGKLYLALALC
ncbi:hypothetical protein [Streptomyces albogriseolus]|uniref:hypothetical protein n=1 Tax=Streptomyces albogriseolus TaxID=1887 RepID=UPI00345FB7D3